MPSRSQQYLSGLVRELRGLPDETEWAEFKTNNTDGEAIGEYISALANSAALEGKAAGYLVWGIEDAAHDIVGTSFRPKAERRGNEELEELLDYPSYFDLMGQRFPDGRAGILAALERERLIVRDDAGRWSITSLGAVLFAKTLEAFPKLGRKSLRVIEYAGSSRMSSARERCFTRGYASGFEDMIGHVNSAEAASTRWSSRPSSTSCRPRSSRSPATPRGRSCSPTGRCRRWTRRIASAPAICMPA